MTAIAPAERMSDRAAAHYLGICLGTLRSMMSRRQVPFVRLGKRLAVFEREALDAFIASKRVSPEGSK